MVVVDPNERDSRRGSDVAEEAGFHCPVTGDFTPFADSKTQKESHTQRALSSPPIFLTTGLEHNIEGWGVLAYLQLRTMTTKKQGQLFHLVPLTSQLQRYPGNPR